MCGDDVLMLRIAPQDFKELPHGPWVQKALRLIDHDNSGRIGSHDHIQNREHLANSGPALCKWDCQVLTLTLRWNSPNEHACGGCIDDWCCNLSNVRKDRPYMGFKSIESGWIAGPQPIEHLWKVRCV